MRTLFTRAFVLSISLLAFTASAITPVAQTYIEKAIQIMRDELLGSEKIDWDKVTAKAVETAKDATTTGETYEAIREALRAVDGTTAWLDDPFTSTGPGLFIGIKTVNYRDQRVVARVSAGSAGERAGIRPGDTFLTLNNKPVLIEGSLFPAGTKRVTLTLRRVGTADPIKLEFDLAPSTFDETPATVTRLADRVIYVDLPGTIDADGLAGSGYATRAHEAIRQASVKPTCGWVVDLRRNWNGLNEGYATLGAIIGDGKLGGFKGAKLEETYSYRQGSLYVNDKPLVTVTQPFVPAKDLPIAILQGPQTDWSGEAFTLAIKARANTRSFGERSNGGTSNWNIFKLSDGAEMGFRIAKMIDPNGKAYNTEILDPDQQVPLDPTLYDRPEDPMIKMALEWLKSQPACK